MVQGYPPTGIHLLTSALVALQEQQQQKEQLLSLSVQQARWWQLVDPYPMGVQG